MFQNSQWGVLIKINFYKSLFVQKRWKNNICALVVWSPRWTHKGNLEAQIMNVKYNEGSLAERLSI